MQVAQVDFLFGPAPTNFERGDEELAGDRAFYASILISSWHMHGQGVSNERLLIKTEHGRRAWLIVPDDDSLSPEHDSRHAAGDRAKLRELNVSIEIQLLGKELSDETPTNRDYSPKTCQCEKRSSLILFTNYFVPNVPLRCGDCFDIVPLYKIPFEDEEHYKPHEDIRSWESNYNGCDILQLGCTLGEKWALRQMGRHKSKLSKQGRKLCRRLEKLLGVPVYYYLHRYYGKSWKKEEARKCPRCRGKWKLEEENKRFDFRCDKCRLLSDIAMDIED